jgi:hypothetical protein
MRALAYRVVGDHGQAILHSVAVFGSLDPNHSGRSIYAVAACVGSERTKIGKCVVALAVSEQQI